METDNEDPDLKRVATAIPAIFEIGKKCNSKRRFEPYISKGWRDIYFKTLAN